MPETHWDRLPESERQRIHEQTQGPRLSPPHQAALERLTGQDLSTVRVHYNARRPEMRGARAFVTGNDIYLPATHNGEALAAHEAAHVVQQRAGLANFGGNPNAPVGQEADRLEVRAAQSRGQP